MLEIWEERRLREVIFLESGRVNLFWEVELDVLKIWIIDLSFNLFFF